MPPGKRAHLSRWRACYCCHRRIWGQIEIRGPTLRLHYVNELEFEFHFDGLDIGLASFDFVGQGSRPEGSKEEESSGARRIG